MEQELHLKAMKYFLDVFTGKNEELPVLSLEEYPIFMGALSGLLSGTGEIIKKQHRKSYNVLVDSIETLALR